ncbi:MAG TPA: ESX secretion-associated protein EspG [Amycolatopsis sp.]
MTAVVARAGQETVRIGLVEADLLAAHAGAGWPFPLRVPAFGRIAGERELLLDVAAQTLQARRLADDAGPEGLAAEAVTALRENRGVVHLVVTGADGTTGVAAIVYRSAALICRQTLDDDPAGTLTLRRVPETAVIDALLDEIPKVDPARALPITVPAAAVDAAMALDDASEDDASRVRTLRALVRDHGGDPEALDHLVGLLVPVTGRGQLGATRDGCTPAGSELSWVDGPRGRVRVNRPGDGWLSVNPVRANDLRFALGELATLARRPR